ncbi:hypothetical protein Y032_0229g2926 [Ancylostoma ceylanicum]|uniref:Uncharacterized protein n=1 Tax=Ancylostoma ceylanicum TaxID=53326 RepID=A0A016SGZ9_9BILA|nr:hypothetical protein Y032_0229g2926 [Ancylostoma ceylanicum]
MEDEPSKAQFFFGESDEDSLGLVDNKSDFPHTVPDPSRNDGGAVSGSSFPAEEQAELPNFSENVQAENPNPTSSSFRDTSQAHYSSERDDDVPAQVSGNYEGSSRPAAQETCDVPVVLTDDGSSDSVGYTGAADGEVPAEVHEGAALPSANAHEGTANSQGGRNANLTDSEDVPIEVVEVDVENTGDVPDAPFNDSLDGVPPITGTSTAADNHLCDVSDDEMDQLPRARPNKELDELVDCDGFRNGTGRASSIPPESPPPGESFIYDNDFSPITNKRPGPSTSDEFNGVVRKVPRQSGGREREVSHSPPAPPSTPPRDDRRTRLENLKKLNFPTKYKMKDRIDALSPPHGPSTPPYDGVYDSTQPRRSVRSFLDEPGSEFLTLSRDRENSSSRNRSPEVSSRRKRRHDDDGDRGDDRERGRHGWADSGDRRGHREDWRSERDDQHHGDMDNGLEDLSNNPAELQRRCNAHIAMSENQAATVSDDQLFNAVSEALYLLANAQRLCKKREKLLNEMKAMRQGEVDMMKAIHADLPAHLQSVVRIEGDSVFINESGLAGGLPSTASAPAFQQSYNPVAVPPGMYVNPNPAPPVGLTPFLVPPGVPTMMASKPTISVIPPVLSSAIQPVAESTSGTTVAVPPPAKSESPDVDAGAESSMTSSFTNMPSSFSHPPPPLSSGPPQPAAAPSTVQAASSPGPALAGLPDFSKPPPTLRPVNGTSNGSLPKTGSSSALPDVAIASTRSSSSTAVASSTVPPPSSAPPLNFNIPPPNVPPSGSGLYLRPFVTFAAHKLSSNTQCNSQGFVPFLAGTARAPYMQPSSFLGPPQGSDPFLLFYSFSFFFYSLVIISVSATSTPAAAADFTKTITNMITSALKAPGNAGVNAFGAGPGIRTYVGPSMSLLGGPPQNLHDGGGGGGDGDWSNNRGRYQYRGKSGYGKRQGNDHRRGGQFFFLL